MNGKIKNKKALAVVAHPDDETIWMGGFILRHPQFDWTILSLCRASDPDRAPKFKRVCRLYKARSLMFDLNDEGELSFEQAAIGAKQIIARATAGEKFDLVFTHGANGEYGHYLHQAVHLAVKELVGEKRISAKQIYFFNYQKGETKPLIKMTAKKDSDLICPLSAANFSQRKKAMVEIYGFDPNGIDTGLCPEKEGFKIFKI